MNNILKHIQQKLLLTACIGITFLSLYEPVPAGWIPKKYVRVKGDWPRFESQGKSHSAYFILRSDKTFTFYMIGEGRFDLTMGSYTQKIDTIIFNWDAVRTGKAITTPAIYTRYFQFSHPRQYEMTDVRYILRGDTLLHSE